MEEDGPCCSLGLQLTPSIWAFLGGSSPGRVPEGSSQECLEHLAMQHFRALISPDRHPVCRERALLCCPHHEGFEQMMPTCLVFSALLPNSPRDDVPGPGV